MLSGVSLEIEKVERALRQMETQMEKGFRSDTEVKTFLKSMEQTENAVLSIHKGLRDVANVSLADSAKDLNTELEKINKQIAAAEKNFKSMMTKNINEAIMPQATKEYLKNLVQQGKLQKQNFDEAKKQIQQEIALKRKSYNQIQDELLLKKKVAAMDKALNVKKSKGLFGEGGITSDQLELSSKWGTAGGAPLGKMVRGKTGTGNVRPKVKSANFNEVINEHYVQILKEMVIQGKAVDDIMDALLVRFKEFGLLSGGKKIEATSSLGTNLRAVIERDFGKARTAIGNVGSVADNSTLKGLASEMEGYKAATELFKQWGEQLDQVNQRTAALNQRSQDFINTEKQQSAAVRETVISLEQQSSDIGQATSQWEDYKTQLIDATKQQEQIDDSFQQIINRLKYFFSIGTVFNFIRKEISQTFEDVKNLDKSFAQIAMVTKYSVNEMWQSYDQYAEMANRLGQSTNDVIQASALFYQQGLDTNEVLELTEDTMKLATLAGIDYAEATDLMTSALRGFHLEMDQGSHITDVYSELAAHAAANVQEIAVAMNKTAAIAASAGMEFETTAAFLTQMINFGPL